MISCSEPPLGMRMQIIQAFCERERETHPCRRNKALQVRRTDVEAWICIFYLEIFVMIFRPSTHKGLISKSIDNANVNCTSSWNSMFCCVLPPTFLFLFPPLYRFVWFMNLKKKTQTEQLISFLNYTTSCIYWRTQKNILFYIL